MRTRHEMKRVGVWAAAAALVVILGSCGGGGDSDSQVLRFVGFSSVGLTQADAVRESSADVDVVQDLCPGEPPTVECFTQTIINATFVNEGYANIQLRNYVVDTPSQSGIGAPRQRVVTANLPGGRCANIDRRCAVDEDCRVGATIGVCSHERTTVFGLLLYDLDDKIRVSPEVFGQSLNVTITFSGVDDADNERTITTSYTVTFADFNNCDSEACGGEGT